MDQITVVTPAELLCRKRALRLEEASPQFLDAAGRPDQELIVSAPEVLGLVFQGTAATP